MRITTDPGTDLAPVAATDTAGRVWVAWQGIRNNNLEVLASVQQTDSFSPETIVSISPASDWDPAIAVAPAEKWPFPGTPTIRAITTCIYAAPGSPEDGIDNPIPMAASVSFEARSSLAYDARAGYGSPTKRPDQSGGRIRNGHDTTGMGLYQNHSIPVRGLIGGDLYATTDPVAHACRVQRARSFSPRPQRRTSAQPNPAAAQNRQPNKGVPAASGPKNSFPRLTTDSEGAVYLAYRHPGGKGTSSSLATAIT